MHQQAGFSSQAIDYRQTAIVFNMAVTADTQRQVYERFTHRGLIALLPLAKNRCGVVWINSSAETQKLLAMRRTRFSRKLQETIGDRLGQITEIGPRQTYPLKLRWVEDVCRQRVLLMGNAAHTLHPVAAQGLNLSLRDVKFFAQQVLRGQQDPGRSIRQSDYRRRRRRDSRRVMAFTHSLIRFFSLPLGPLQGGALCVLDLFPPLRRMIVRNMLSLTMAGARSATRLPTDYGGD